jgi:hypothetical protein
MLLANKLERPLSKKPLLGYVQTLLKKYKIKLKRLARGKRSSLFARSVNNEEKSFMTLIKGVDQCYKTFFFVTDAPEK